MHLRLKRRYLLQQTLREAAAGGDRCAGDVVDRLVGIELHALAASVGQGINDMGLHFVQAQLEHLEQAYRARSDDDGIGFNHRGSHADFVISGSAARACRSCLSSRQHLPEEPCAW